MSRYLYVAAFYFIASCSSEKPFTKNIRNDVYGIDFVVEHRSGPALSLSEDRVYAKVGDERVLVFEGYGGKGVALKNASDSIVIIEYCYGSIRKVDSILSKSPTTRDAVVIKIQPVIAANIVVGGHILCPK